MSPRKQMRPFDHIVILCQSCRTGALNPAFVDAVRKTVWECEECKRWFVWTRWGWAMIDGAQASRQEAEPCSS
jgi:hypothetical protein